MAEWTVELPPFDTGVRVAVPLPDGEWVAPPGWAIEGRVLTTVWKRDTPSTVTVTSPPEVLCGLCGEPILAADITISRQGILNPIAGDPDAHTSCYRKAVEVKVSRAGGPADPWAVPATPTPPVVPPQPPTTPPGGQP